jgi:IstB-like ATP binding protein
MKTLETKSMVLLGHHLKALRLPTVGAECEKVAHQCAADNVDHLTYLLQLTELELLEREKRAAERRLKAARFPTLKTLDTFDFTARPSVNKMLVTELARGEFIDKRENVLLVGNPAPARVISRPRSRSRHATRATRSGSTGPPNSSPPSSKPATNATSFGSRPSWRNSTCWSSTSSATSPHPKSVPNCYSTSSPPPTNAPV